VRGRPWRAGPTIVYNVPARTSQDIPPELMLQLAKHENFAGEAHAPHPGLRNRLWNRVPEP